MSQIVEIEFARPFNASLSSHLMVVFLEVPSLLIVLTVALLFVFLFMTAVFFFSFAILDLIKYLGNLMLLLPHNFSSLKGIKLFPSCFQCLTYFCLSLTTFFYSSFSRPVLQSSVMNAELPI